MVAEGDFASIAAVCTAIGNEITDDSGFVPVRRLLSRFHADLLIRPLLVEGMLASGVGAQTRNGNQWTVLVDSETYAYTNQDVEEERTTRPLPYRMRNTIAHELVHSLAFRSSEFGIRLRTRTDTKESLREFVKALEGETERLSPLLLWSEKSLAIMLRGKKETLSLSDFVYVLKNFGISRYVLVSRLLLIRPATDLMDFLFSPGLRNIAVGLGTWGPKNAIIKGWPLFWNFEHGNVPSFLVKAKTQDRAPAETVFSDETFAMLGGPNNVVDLETSAGTRSAPELKRMKVHIEVEEGLRREGEEFLFVLREI